MIKTFVLDLANRIVIGKIGAIGLAIMSALGIQGVQPGLQIQSPHGRPLLTLSSSGAIGVGTNYGNAGDCLKSGGGSGKLMSYGTCGSGGGGGSSNTGAILRAGDDRFVNTSGDTMTGALLVKAAISGASLRIDNLKGCDTIDTSVAGVLSCGTDNTGTDTADDLSDNDTDDLAEGTGNLYHTSERVDDRVDALIVDGTNISTSYNDGANTLTINATDTNTTYIAGQGLTLNGSMFVLNSTNSGSLSRYLTQSGSLVFARNTLASSGSLVWEGTASGAALVVSSQFSGAGLSDCDNATDSKLLWDLTSKRFSCGADQSGGGGGSAWSGTGALAVFFDRAYVNTSGDTMTGALTIKKASGTATGNTLIVDTKGLVYDATNKRVGINTASPQDRLHVSGSLLLSNNSALKFGRANGNTENVLTYGIDNRVYFQNTAGDFYLRSGASANYYITLLTTGRVGIGKDVFSPGSILSVSGATIINPTGAGGLTAQAGVALEVIGTASGRVLQAMDTLASSGSVAWEGTASGANLIASSQFSGAGLTDCDAAGQTLNWDATSKRFSCGTDAEGSGSFSQDAADARYVQIQGDTMTGGLLIQDAGTPGTIDAGLLLEVLGTMSGRTLKAGGGHVEIGGEGGFAGYLSMEDQEGNEQVLIEVLDAGGNPGRITLSDQTANALVILSADDSGTDLELYDLDGENIIAFNIDATPTFRFSNADDTRAVLFGNLSTERLGVRTASPDTTLDVVGGMSGSSLTVSGLVSCSSLQTNSAGALSCGSAGGLPAGGSSGQTLINQGVSTAIWRYERECERHILFGPQVNAVAGSGVTFPTLFSGSLLSANLQASGYGSGVAINVYFNNRRAFSTPLTTDNREANSSTALTPVVYSATGRRFNKSQDMRIDVSSAGTPLSSTGVVLSLCYDVTSW